MKSRTRARIPRRATVHVHPPRGHGGARPGAGRKPGARSGVPHRRRKWHHPNHPLHVTVRVTKKCWNLRSGRSFRVLRRVFVAAAGRFGTRLIEYSIQGNHLHMIVESTDRVALGRAMKGLGVRVAKHMNRLMGRKGKVIATRYYARALRTPLEVKRALHYVLNNHRRHAAQSKKTLPRMWLDPFSTARAFKGWRDCPPELVERTRDPCRDLPLGVLKPKTSLLERDWRRLGLLEIAFVPGPRVA